MSCYEALILLSLVLAPIFLLLLYLINYLIDQSRHGAKNKSFMWTEKATVLFEVEKKE